MEAEARRIADALRALGYRVWRDDELPAHRSYTDVIEERLRAAKAVVVLWSAEAVKSQWVRAEAEVAREAGALVQIRLDASVLPLPFNQIQCADLRGWAGEPDASGWLKVVGSVADLVAGGGEPPAIAQPPPPAMASTKPSIAVLPFANLSGDAEQDYFADGMVVEIVAALSRIRSIFVIASGSSLALKDRSLAPQEAARKLGVRYVLAGSVRRAAGRVRIAVQLIDASDGAQIWSRRFEDDLEDVFALQDKVALSAAAVIEPAVREAEIMRAAARPTEDPGSYDLYLRASAAVRDYVAQDLHKALDLAERAVGLDPNHGAAVVLAAQIHAMVCLYGWSDEPEPHRRRAIELAHRALKLAPDDAYIVSHVARVVAYVERDPETALAHIDRALALNPGCVTAWVWSGAVRVLTGDFDLAISHLEGAARLDPMGPDRRLCEMYTAMARFQQKRFDAAVSVARDLAVQIDSPAGFAILAASYGHMDLIAAASDALGRYRTLARQPIEAFADAFWHQPTQRRLFLDGIALAEGKAPSPAPPSER